MKTLVKYLPDNHPIVLQFGAFHKSVHMVAGDATKHGFGDHTVQPNRRTVLCAKADYSKLDFFLKRV